jgi:hypothetical protein
LLIVHRRKAKEEAETPNASLLSTMGAGSEFDQPPVPSNDRYDDDPEVRSLGWARALL